MGVPSHLFHSHLHSGLNSLKPSYSFPKPTYHGFKPITSPSLPNVPHSSTPTYPSSLSSHPSTFPLSPSLTHINTIEEENTASTIVCSSELDSKCHNQNIKTQDISLKNILNTNELHLEDDLPKYFQSQIYPVLFSDTDTETTED